MTHSLTQKRIKPMKTFYKYAAFAAAALAGLCACSSDDDAAETGSGLQPVAQPQIIVSDLTTTGFTLRWEAVDDAGSYVYTFDGGSETSTTGCRLEFNSLERQKEYVVAVKACPRDPAEYTESPFTYIHVLTDDLEQLPQPKITLGSAYASKTVIPCPKRNSTSSRSTAGRCRPPETVRSSCRNSTRAAPTPSRCAP